MLVIGLAAFDLRVTIVVKLVGFFLHLRLAAEEHVLWTDHARAPGVGERGKDVEAEGIVTLARWLARESPATPEAAVGGFVALFGKDFLLEPILLSLIIRLLCGFQPPEVV